MKSMQATRALLIVVSFLLLGATARAQEISASSGFNKPAVRAGETFHWHFTLTGKNADPQVDPSVVPSVDGLELTFAQMSPSVSTYIINGHRTTRISNQYVFQARADQPGVYSVPAFTVEVDGRPVRVPSSSVRVLERSDLSETPIFAELVLPRENLYVGEAILAEVKLRWNPEKISAVRAASDNFMRVAEGDAFRVSDFSNEQSTQIVEGGVRWKEHRWQVLITPLKTGPQPLVIQIDLAVGAGQPRSTIDRMLGRVNWQRVKIHTEGKDRQILPLPTEGRPMDFTGGIGMFSVDQPEISNPQPTEGEPVTLTLVVRGQGNFDRLGAPALVVSDNWRNYEPSATFDPVDQVGYQGVKTFEYTIIPRNSGELETPEIAFNFFNPDTAKYVELPIPGESVTVAPNPNARPAQPKVRNPVAARRGPELLPIATNPGKWVRSIKPVLTNPFFWGAQVIPALAFGLLFVRRREQLRLQNDPAYARRVRAAQMVNDERDRARRAVLGKQVVAFYEAAQRGVQAAAGQTVEAEPGSLTAADVDRIAQAKGLSNKQRDTLKAFFETGDAIRFSGVSAAEVHFESELARLEEVLQALGGSTE